MKTEQIVAVLPGADPCERIVIALDSSAEPKPISVRSESFSSDVGWFAQSELRLSRSEMAGLRNVLGVPVAKACHFAVDQIEEARMDDEPMVLSFASYRRA
ncbi:hypothetical protein SH467x_003059 [Pirellulaceae bacterium SH467]